MTQGEIVIYKLNSGQTCAAMILEVLDAAEDRCKIQLFRGEKFPEIINGSKHGDGVGEWRYVSEG